MAKDKAENVPPSLSPGASTPITSSVPSTPIAGSANTPGSAANPTPTQPPAPSPVDGNPMLIDENKEKEEKERKEAEEAAAEKALKNNNGKSKKPENPGEPLLMQHLVDMAQEKKDHFNENNSLSTLDGSAATVKKGGKAFTGLVGKGVDKLKGLMGSKGVEPDPATNLLPATDTVGTATDLAQGIQDGASPKPDESTPSPTPPASDVADVPDPSKLGLS